ncbi:hypothetical protein L1987_71256 [Smallanthus sonchifolius]|uniref:Uncharacterized protein n=1 Tax=Smallanthus sonchifolius TaxID=185202 RepID=A0ACB9AS87_9ASTR|nr:hypothetical protein L1987_71256 [Smallanthus sonchifolius]
MAGKGGKGLLAGKAPAAAANKDKDKKRPTPRSDRAGLQEMGFSGGLAIALFFGNPGKHVRSVVRIKNHCSSHVAFKVSDTNLTSISRPTNGAY